MDSRYKIEDASEIFSPGLVVFREVLESNIDKMIELAGGPVRLRPHCKTHKMREVTAMLLERGIEKHKCATFAEAEMLVEVGVKDIFLAYSLVGPNIARAVAFRQKYADVLFSVTADHQKPIAELDRAMSGAGQTIEVLLDLDSGQHRTGLPVGQQAGKLYQQIADCSGLVPGGLHLYDGQNHQTAVDERAAAVDECWQATIEFRDQLVEAGCAVPRYPGPLSAYEVVWKNYMAEPGFRSAWSNLRGEYAEDFCQWVDSVSAAPKGDVPPPG